MDDAPILEPGSPIVWFTFEDAWHDVGRFHRADGTFTGFYANVLTPVAGFHGREWSTTDLFLDVWIPASGASARVLDADELAEALARGWIDDTVAAQASAEANRLLEQARAGSWPPAIVREWTLERARDVSRHNESTSV